MTLYTVMPPEQIWSGMWKEDEGTQDVRINGILMQVRPTSGNEAVIVRLLDCPLEAYLEPGHLPGSVIRIPHVGGTA